MVSVMQRTETGEVFCAGEFRNYDEAFNWILENEDSYPESSFYTEGD